MDRLAVTFAVNIRWGHIDRMPKCAHGRAQGFCACFERSLAPIEAGTATTPKSGVVRSTKAGLAPTPSLSTPSKKAVA